MREPACPLVQGPYRLYPPIFSSEVAREVHYIEFFRNTLYHLDIYKGHFTNDYFQALHPQLAVDQHQSHMRSSHSLSPNQGL